MEVGRIYEPVRKELVGVERNLEGVASADVPFLATLLQHVLRDGGKRIRPALALLVGKSYSSDVEHLISMATCVELLHTATLVHDDTVDSSATRRGKPTVHSLWGNTRAILLGDYLFGKAAIYATKTDSMRATKLFAQTVAVISGGELEKTVTDFEFDRLREHYYRWIGAKTACLFSAAAEGGAVVGDAPEEAIETMRQYGYDVGMAFQIVDDILDFVGAETDMGKPVGSDLTQGVLTLPTILFLEKHPDIVAGRDPKKKVSTLLEDIRQPGIIDASYKIAGEYCERALVCLQRLPDNIYREALGDLTNYVLRRTK